MLTRIASVTLGLTAALAVALPAVSQTATRKASKTDWSVFVEEPPAVTQKTCWLASAPSKVENTRNGAPAPNVDRGEIVIFVLYVPGETDENGNPINGQVSFSTGYPMAAGATGQLQIGSARYDLYTDEGVSNPDMLYADPFQDANIRNSMKRGAEAVITARSARGTDTKDTFSLTGFTAAIEEIEKLCGA